MITDAIACDFSNPLADGFQQCLGRWLNPAHWASTSVTLEPARHTVSYSELVEESSPMKRGLKAEHPNHGYPHVLVEEVEESSLMKRGLKELTENRPPSSPLR